jgi:anti-anti-sigma factor
MTSEPGDMGGTAGISTRAGATSTTIELTGELDISAAPALGEEVARACASRTAELVIDLSGLQFIDSAGLREVLAAGETCEREGCRLRLIPGPPNVQRVFEISGLLDHLPFAEG